MTTSEPTTARDTNVPTTENIAKALRVCFEKTCACSECPFEHESCGDLEQLAADRLERQERELSGITGELERFRAFHERYAEQTSKKYVADICALTARAEQAERERDALLTDFSTIERDGVCEVCFFGDSSQISKEDCMEDCCFNYRTRRGLPQEGDKDE